MKEFNINAEDRLKIEVVFNLFKFYWTFKNRRFCRFNILHFLNKIDIGEEFEEHDERIFKHCMLFYNKLFSSSSDLSESDRSAMLKELIDINNKFPEHTMCIEEVNDIVTYKSRKYGTNVPNHAYIYEDEEGKLYCLVDRDCYLFGYRMYIFNKDKNKWEEDACTSFTNFNLLSFIENYGEKRFRPTNYDYPFYHDGVTINGKIISGGDLHTYKNWQNRRLHR